MVDLGSSLVEQRRRQAIGPSHIRGVPQLRPPELDEVGISLDLLDNGLGDVRISRSSGLLKWPRKRGKCLVPREGVHFLAPEEALAVRARFSAEFEARVGRPHSTTANGSSWRCRATRGAINSESGCSPCRSRSSRISWASSRSRTSPSRPLDIASSTVANRLCARSSSCWEPGAMDSEMSSQVTDRLPPRNVLPAAARSLSRRERAGSGSRSPPIASWSASSVLWEGSGPPARRAPSWHFRPARRRHREARSYPRPRSPVSPHARLLLGSSRSIAPKRRSEASRPAR